MMKKLLIGLVALTAHFSYGQNEWVMSYGNDGYDYCRDLLVDTDSNYVLTGASSSFVGGSSDAYLMRVDTTGAFLWSYPYGGSGIDWSNSLVITADDSYAMAGFSNSDGAGGYDFYVIRANADGTPQWEKWYGGSDWDKAYDLCQLPDGGFIVVGDTYSYGDSTLNGYAIRIDAAGDTIWTKLFDGPGESYLRGIHIDAAGDSVIVAGGSEAGGLGLMDGYIAKMDLNGNIGWEKFIGTASEEYFNDVYGDLGFYALGGMTKRKEATQNSDIWMVKIDDSNGTVIYDTTDAGFAFGYEHVNGVTFNPANGQMLYAGACTSWGFGTSDGKFDFYFGRIDVDGDDLQSHPVGLHGDDEAHAIAVTPDGGAIIAGDTKSYSTGGNSVLLYKMKSSWAYPDETMVVYNNITTGLVICDPKQELTVFPNPATAVVNIHNGEEILGVELYSTSGKVIQSYPAGTAELNIADLKVGTYILKVFTDGETHTKRIIKK